MGSCLATAIKCPRRFLVLIRRRRTFVARVHFWSKSAWVKFLALGRLFTNETRIYFMGYNSKTVLSLLIFGLDFPYLSSLDRKHFRVVSSTNNVIVAADFSISRGVEEVIAVRRRIGEILPRLERFSVVDRFLERPNTRSWRIRHFDIYIGHMEFLNKHDVIDNAWLWFEVQ